MYIIIVAIIREKERNRGIEKEDRDREIEEHKGQDTDRQTDATDGTEIQAATEGLARVLSLVSYIGHKSKLAT